MANKLRKPNKKRKPNGGARKLKRPKGRKKY